MLSFFQNKNSETTIRDPEEILLLFQVNPDVFLNRYLRKSDPARREALLELTESYSLSFSSGLIALTRGNISRKNENAVKDALYRTDYSREFVDLAISLGLLEKSLESIPERVSRYQEKLKFLFESHHSPNHTEANTTLGYTFCRAVSDIENLAEAMSSLSSFDNIGHHLYSFTQTFRKQGGTFSEKVAAAVSFYLLIHADEEIRESIRDSDVSSWIDIYDPTDIDLELIESWLGYCDPLMKAGYYSQLVEAQSDLSERGERAQTVLNILENTHQKTKPSHLGLGGQVVDELETLGIYCKISSEVLENSITRCCPEVSEKSSSYAELQSQARQRVGMIVDIILEQNDITIYPSANSTAITPCAEEKETIHRLAKICLGEIGLTTGAVISRKTFSNVLKISNNEIRQSALKLLEEPSNDHFEAFIAKRESPFSEAIITSLLNTDLHDLAFYWLEKNSCDARPHLHRRLIEQGLENELVAISLLSLISKSQIPDKELALLLAKQFKREKRPLIQTHLIRALGATQSNDTQYFSVFQNSINQMHLQVEAIQALAVCGAKGLEFLETILHRKGIRTSANLHERKTPSLSNDQKIILSALPAAGPQGGKVLLRFLEGFSDCYTVHLVTDFLRAAKEPHFGMNDTKVWKIFRDYCNRE